MFESRPRARRTGTGFGLALFTLMTLITTGPATAQDWDCNDFDNLPQSFLQPRTQDEVGEVSEFVNLAADDAYMVLAWAEIAGGRALAQSCLSLPAERLRSGRTFSAVMSLVDRC